jgi:hypothetical protein
VCRPDCAAAELQFADIAGELEPLLADALPMRGFVPVACHLVGAARVFLPLVFGAVAAWLGRPHLAQVLSGITRGRAPPQRV